MNIIQIFHCYKLMVGFVISLTKTISDMVFESVFKMYLKIIIHVLLDKYRLIRKPTGWKGIKNIR